MKQSIKNAIEAARLRSKERPSEVESRPVLVSSPVIQTALKEIMDGDTFTIPDVMETLKCEKDKAIRVVKTRLGRGAVKIGKSYLIPRTVFEEIILEALVA